MCQVAQVVKAKGKLKATNNLYGNYCWKLQNKTKNKIVSLAKKTCTFPIKAFYGKKSFAALQHSAWINKNKMLSGKTYESNLSKKNIG